MMPRLRGAQVPFFLLSLLIEERAHVRVSSYPIGAGGCSGEDGSVGGSHWVGPILETGRLANGNFQVQLFEPTATSATTSKDGHVVAAQQQEESSSSSSSSSVVLEERAVAHIEVGREYRIRVSSSKSTTTSTGNSSSTDSTSTFFRGFLFRLAAVDSTLDQDTSSFLFPLDLQQEEEDDNDDSGGSNNNNNAQIADVCTALNIAGVTHKDASLETMNEMTVALLVDAGSSIGGSAMMVVPMKMVLQVTVVSQNDDLSNGTHRSAYYWDTYRIQAWNDLSMVPTTDTYTSSSSGSHPSSPGALISLLGGGSSFFSVLEAAVTTLVRQGCLTGFLSILL